MSKEAIERLKEELTLEELKDMSKDVISWNGSLDWLDYYDNDEYFFQDFFGHKVDDAVRAVCYGDYEYMDDYVRFDGYGNLKSCSQFEYEAEIEDSAEEIIETYMDEFDNMPDGTLKKKIEDLLEEEGE